LGDRSARLRRDRFSVGNFFGTVCFCRPRRESHVEEVGLLEGGCSYSDSGIMGSLLLPPFPQLLEVEVFSQLPDCFCYSLFDSLPLETPSSTAIHCSSLTLLQPLPAHFLTLKIHQPRLPSINLLPDSPSESPPHLTACLSTQNKAASLPRPEPSPFQYQGR
ncbi:hypothetical protein ILYODFUR_036929, partial [Ilyodon furcidens]